MKKCYECNKTLNKDEVSLNKKLLGRKIVQFLCIDCLSIFLSQDVELLREKIDQFKNDGCTLFM